MSIVMGVLSSWPYDDVAATKQRIAVGKTFMFRMPAA
jgi:hypothetical protein